MTAAATVSHDSNLLLTLQVGGRLCGLPVSRIRDVIRCERIARVPLAPSGVAGLLNLRGRIVTAVDLRDRLGLPPAAPDAARMNVVVEERGELYSLLADGVGEVLSVDRDARTDVPHTLRGPWREHAVAVHRLDDGLLIELDADRILAFGARSGSDMRR